MAGTLTEGVQYGLSSNGLPSENKSLVFVKLTDSSFKAIEEYLRIKLKTHQQPNIQFLGNEGRLWFPTSTSSSADGGGGGAAFSFSLSSAAVVGGPQGSFECVQQCGSRSLESLGVMALKMNVKAKDDVYEATRQRMAVAEEESKKNCTRVIKLACGPDIGRVVKIRKQAAAAVFPPRRDRDRQQPEDSLPPHQQPAPAPTLSSLSSHRSTSATSSSLLSSSSSSLSSSSLYSSSSTTTHHSHVVQNGRTGNNSPALGSSTAANASTNGRSSNAISPLPRSAASPSYTSTTTTTTTTSSNARDGYNQGNGVETNPDLMRRPLRDRIIHLLAIRPYKKPELVSRLHKEGLKEKDKKLIMPVLTAVGLIKDQAYHLARHIWNDIHDDWPFYTDSEKQLLKRRKPQNLTPPVSDSSSGSGHSPPSSSSGLHHHQHHHNGSSNGSPPLVSSIRASPNSGGGVKRPGSSNDTAALLDAAAAAAAKKPRISHYKKPDSSQPQQPQNHSSSTMMDSRHNAQIQKSSPSLKVRPSPPNHAPYGNHAQQNNNNNFRPGGMLSSSSVMHSSNGNGAHHHHPVISTRVTSSTDGPDTPNSSPDSMTMESSTEMVSHHHLNGSGGAVEETVAEYTNQYQRIVSGEQRSRYKEDFNAQYNEYRDLHKAIDKVSKRFAQLEEELRQQHEGTTAYKRIKHQILREYRDNLRDSKYRETKRRFQHLHEKLAYIKQLVLEWDMAQTCRS